MECSATFYAKVDLGFEVFLDSLGDDFRKMLACTLMRQSTGLSHNVTHFPREDGLGDMTSGKCLRILRCAWLNSGCSTRGRQRSFSKYFTHFLREDGLGERTSGNCFLFSVTGSTTVHAHVSVSGAEFHTVFKFVTFNCRFVGTESGMDY